MAWPGNEVSAVNEQRRNEELSNSSVGGLLGEGASAAGVTAALGASLASHGGLAIAGSVVAGMGIVDWFRKLGTSKVNENLEELGQATEDALHRVDTANPSTKSKRGSTATSSATQWQARRCKL